MTAKELHDHVIQWPEGARPKGLRLHTAGWFVEDRETGRRAEGETLRVDFQFCNPTTSIASGRLIISIGVDTLVSAAERCPRFYDGERDRYTLTVADKEKFATEVVRALQHEEEDGTTPLHVLFDSAFEAAVGDGCEGAALAACPPKTESEA